MKMIQTIFVDLHIHTCISPCGGVDMTPHEIVEESIKKGLSIIAITDHNSAENTQAVITAAKDTGLYVIPGMEITTSDEIHIIGLFESVDKALKMQELVIVNKYDDTEGSRWLSTDATELNIYQALDHIHTEILTRSLPDRCSKRYLRYLKGSSPFIFADSIRL